MGVVSPYRYDYIVSHSQGKFNYHFAGNGRILATSLPAASGGGKGKRSVCFMCCMLAPGKHYIRRSAALCNTVGKTQARDFGRSGCRAPQTGGRIPRLPLRQAQGPLGMPRFCGIWENFGKCETEKGHPGRSVLFCWSRVRESIRSSSHQCLHWWQQHPTGVLHSQFDSRTA